MCHVESWDLSDVSANIVDHYTFTRKMETELFAETLDKSQVLDANTGKLKLHLDFQPRYYRQKRTILSILCMASGAKGKNIVADVSKDENAWSWENGGRLENIL